MNDEELPINAELASAYLDGELDAAERAAACRRSRGHGTGRFVRPGTRRARRRRAGRRQHQAPRRWPPRSPSSTPSTGSPRSSHLHAARGQRHLVAVAAHARLPGAHRCRRCRHRRRRCGGRAQLGEQRRRRSASSAIEASAGTEALPDLKVAAPAGRSSCRHRDRRRFGGRDRPRRQRSRARRVALPEIETADALREYAAAVDGPNARRASGRSPDATAAPADAAADDAATPESIVPRVRSERHRLDHVPRHVGVRRARRRRPARFRPSMHPTAAC